MSLGLKLLSRLMYVPPLKGDDHHHCRIQLKKYDRPTTNSVLLLSIGVRHGTGRNPGLQADLYTDGNIEASIRLVQTKNDPTEPKTLADGLTRIILPL